MTTPSSSNCIYDDCDDGDNWIPLQEEPLEEPIASKASQGPPSSVLNQTRMTPRTTSTSAISTRRNNDNKNGPADLRMLQRKLETNMNLKRGLVDHPLDLAWQRFIVHLGRELWELDLSIRLGVVMAIIGTIFQSIVMATFFPWYDPRTIMLVLIFGVSGFYLAPKMNLDDPMQAFASLVHLPRLSATQIRVVFLICFLIPTWLETRTVGFLSQVLIEAGWGYNLFVTAIVCSVMTYRRKKQPFLSPRQHFYTSIYILYGGALWICLLHFRIADIPKTAGPFLLSSGTLLLSRGDQGQYTRALRHALRLTLRDTLAALSDNVQQDEMLQLAMLRWIVDYWSTRPADTPPKTSKPPSSNSRPSTTVPVREQPERLGLQEIAPNMESRRPVEPVAGPTAKNRAQRRGSRRQLTNAEDIQWNDLLPMLDMTTNQMEDEVYHTPHSNSNDSVKNLREMLTSMDVDDHAKPAVEAYKQLIIDFPPSRETALALSVVKRCPASLVLIGRYMLASVLAIPSTVTLMPLVVIEIYRVFDWAEACHRAVTTEEESVNVSPSIRIITSIPRTLDTMSLLLSPDNYSPLRPPTLLQVWFNIQGSVLALEAGLAAARCAQTTVAAAEFGDHLMSLAHLGFEVSQKGLVHGLGIMVKELIHLQVDAEEGRYTRAAKGALRNSQTMAHNVQVLVEEDAPIIGFLQAVVGRGWLWGHEERNPPIPESSVVITELKEGEDEISEIMKEPAVVRDVKPAPRVAPSRDILEAMELVAVAHRRSLISEAERASFSQILQGAPDTSAIESVKASLNSMLEEEQEQNIKQSHQIVQTSTAVVLTADAYERGLISETEKNSFMGMLASNPETEAVGSTQKSLNRVIEEAESRRNDELARAEDDLYEVKKMITSAFERKEIGETQKSLFEAIVCRKPDRKTVQSIKDSLIGLLQPNEDEQPTSVTSSLILPASSWEVASDGEEEVRESTILRCNESSVVKQEGDTRLSDNFPSICASTSWEETGQGEVENIGSSSWEASVSQKIEPLKDNRPGPELSRRLQLNPDDVATTTTTPAVEEAQQPSDENVDDWGKWVGGGLAVLGAVVGTVALHSAQQQEGSNQKRRRRRDETTGHIVVLSSEVEDDDWVSVSGS